MSFEELLPQIGPWVRNLHTVWPATMVAPHFAIWQVPHILGMAVLGGTAILMGLRLIGVGITEEPASEVRRNLWPWLSAALVLTVASGLATGMVNSERLYTSDAFPPKMLALLAAVVVTYGVAGPVARGEGRMTLASKLAGGVGLALWATALALLATADLVSPGVFHVIFAGALVALVAMKGRLRWIYAAGLVTWLSAQTLATHVLIRPDDYARLDPVNIAFAAILSLWVVGAVTWQVAKSPRAAGPGRAAALAGYVSILAWVTVAAAGRWIAFA